MAITSIIAGLLIGAAVTAAVKIPQAIIASNQAQSIANYQSAVYRAQADYQNQVAQIEAEELARKSKFTFGTQRATAAAMGLGTLGTSFQDIQQMDIGLATLDVQKKLYEGEVALWQGEVGSQMAQYQADVSKYNAWSGAVVGIGLGAVTGAVTGGMGGSFGAMAGNAFSVSLGDIPTFSSTTKPGSSTSATNSSLLSGGGLTSTSTASRVAIA